jgi:mannosyltransferase
VVVLEATPGPLAARRALAIGTGGVAAIVGATGAVVAGIGSWIPSYWGDEAASVMSATRSWASLGVELARIDAVHAVYYAFLHLWTSVFGISELATRMPGVIAVGFIVAGTVVVARQFAGIGFAVLAGLVCMVLPRTTFLATETRSYALSTAAAVWLTVLFIHLIRRKAPKALWVVYGLAAAACAYIFLYLLMMLVVHGVYVVLARRDALGAWARGAVVALLVSSPMIVLGYLQREQIAFLSRRNLATLPNILVVQWFGSVWVAVLCWALIIPCVIALIANRRRYHARLGLLALVWAAVPTLLLVAGNLAVGMYNVRYLSFTTPAVALLIAGGIAVIARRVQRRSGRAGTAVAAGASAVLLVALAALATPSYLIQRSPWAKDGGSDMRQVSEFVGANSRPGEAVVFDQGAKPTRNPRLGLHLYPAGYVGLKDIELAVPYQDGNKLWDQVNFLADSRAGLATVTGVWAIELPQGQAVPPDVVYLQSIGYHVDSSTLIHRTVIFHLIKE